MDRTTGSPWRAVASLRAVRGAGVAAACALVLAACSSSGQGPANSGGGPGVTPSGSYERLTAVEIRETAATNVYDAIRRLRPQWLRRRGRTSLIGAGPDEPVAYVDGARLETLGRLRQYDVERVVEIEFVDAVNATTRFGTGHSGGAIMVTLGN